MTLNGLNVIDFDGSADYLTVDAGSDAIDINPVHVYMVVRIDNNFSGHVGVLSCRTAASGIDETSPNALLIVSQPGHTVVSSYDSATTANVATGGVFCLVKMSYDGTTTSLSVNGGTAGRPSAGDHCPTSDTCGSAPACRPVSRPPTRILAPTASPN